MLLHNCTKDTGTRDISIGKGGRRETSDTSLGDRSLWKQFARGYTFILPSKSPVTLVTIHVARQRALPDVLLVQRSKASHNGGAYRDTYNNKRLRQQITRVTTHASSTRDLLSNLRLVTVGELAALTDYLQTASNPLSRVSIIA